MLTATTHPTPSTPSRRRSPLPLVALCLGYVMVILDVTVVNVALPAIGHGLGAGVTGLQWIVDGYTLTFAGLLLPAGGLGDRLGARRVLLVGMALFLLTSVACGAAPSTAVLVGARLAQGVGAALMVPASLALLGAAYPDRAARARAFGAWGGVAGLGAASGPVIGGALVSGLGWRAVFLVNVPVGVAALVLAVRHVPSPAPHAGRGLDLGPQAVGAAGLGLLTAALIEAGRLGWTSPWVLAGIAAAVVVLAAFVALERRAADAMLPVALFARPTFATAAACGLLFNLAFYGLLFVATLYFQGVRGHSALITGLALLPMSGFVALSSALSGRVTARTGPRRPMVIGMAVGAAGLLGWLVAGAHTSYLLLVVPMAASGFGIAFTMPAATTAIMEDAPADRGGIASGVLNAARQVGSALGIALLGALVADGRPFLGGMHAGVVLGAAAFALGAVLAAWGIRPARLVPA